MSTSGFANETNENSTLKVDKPSGSIDLSTAERLPDGGTTCECYKTVLDGHIVFVKRLKPTLANKASYLEAFRKEYETGSKLHHHSLPDYRQFFGDYIVMDYVDGSTIAELVERGDEWLADEANVRKMMQELLDVIDYLHQHNLVHCDIKVDNVMITAGTRNAMLIDLDKCYTYVHNKRLSGTPANFGLGDDKLGDPALDYRGLAKILEYLEIHVDGFTADPFLRFVKECRRKSTTLPDLKRALKPLLLSSKSGAGNEIGYFVPFTSPVDFNKADRLSWQSTFCDYFRVKMNIRNFVVKRLKYSSEAEPVLALTLKKDYESICEFNHPCLPKYWDYKLTYIIMDNVYGDTLEELIDRQDERLRDVKFVRQFFSELVDTIDYLHKRSVIHCKIYSRDILITHESTIARLLNFEHCYTPSHPLTEGSNLKALNPEKREYIGRPELDFQGLARITRHMMSCVKGFPTRKFTRFVKACQSEKPLIPKLQKALKPHWWELF
ncbi:MAG: protein kinase [Muribaculum sp.]|nr:protein kinase [Muribaculum sp.]